MSQTIDLKSAYEPTDFVKQVYEIQHNRLITWRDRYSKEEYLYKVALNTVYQLMTCELMWNEIVKGFAGKKSFDQFSEAYSYIQQRSGEIAMEHIHSILESKYKTLQNISILDMNSIRDMVTKAQNRNNGKVKDVERTYIWYTGAAELIYGWAALGLTGKNIQQAVAEMCGILIGGNYTNIDTALTNFGQIIDTCNVPLSDLW